jgi:hypothetical protein
MRLSRYARVVTLLAALLIAIAAVRLLTPVTAQTESQGSSPAAPIRNYPVLGSTYGRLDALAEMRGEQGLADPNDLPAATLAQGAEAVDRFLDQFVKDTQARWIRINMNWVWVQSTAGASLNWTYYDPIVRSIKAHGLKLMVILGGAPWAADPSCTMQPTREECQPRPALFAAFAGQAAAHFNGEHKDLLVDAWEIGNEVNCWTWNPHDPALSTQSLIQADARIKAASPSAVVVAGGSGDCPSRDASAAQPPTWDSRDWLVAMYEHGAKGHFDALAHHPYAYDGVDNVATYNPWAKMTHDFPSPTYDTRKSDQCPSPPCLFSHTGLSLRSIMEKYESAPPAGTVKPIWMTEMGVPAPLKRPRLFWPKAWSAAEQQKQLNAAWAVIAESPPGVYGPLFWFSYKDPQVDQPSGFAKDSDLSYYGMIDAKGQAKPVLADFARLSALAAKAAQCASSCPAPVGTGW